MEVARREGDHRPFTCFRAVSILVFMEVARRVDVRFKRMASFLFQSLFLWKSLVELDDAWAATDGI